MAYRQQRERVAVDYLAKAAKKKIIYDPSRLADTNT
jgi:hypothetical protein